MLEEISDEILKVIKKKSEKLRLLSVRCAGMEIINPL